MDHSEDVSGAEHHRLTKLCEPPAYVKQAGVAVSADNVEELPLHVFAIPSRRLYRCHTKAATWMSALYFADKQATLEPHERLLGKRAIEKAADFFGIRPDIDAAFAKIADGQKVAAVDTPASHYGLVWVDDAGTEHRNYPLRNPVEVKVAAEWFVKHRDDFVYGDRRKIATKILERAVDLSQPIDDEAEVLSKIAGYGYAPSSGIADAWDKRAKLIGSSSPVHAKAAADLADRIRKNGLSSRDADVMEKMAGLLDQFDRLSETGLTRYYDKGLDRPEDAIYQITEKFANDFIANHFETPTGKVYEKLKLASLKATDVRSWMGDKVADAIKRADGSIDIDKFAEMLTVIPKPDATTFDQMAEAHAITPSMVQKAAAWQGFTKDELVGLREVYKDAKKKIAAMA